MKPCIACGIIKPLTDFYRHSEMADGHLGVCKECHKARMKARRLTNPEIQKRDRRRAKSPGRRAHADRVSRAWRQKHPLATKAQRAVAYALRVGSLVREPCALCGADEHIHAHHRDYSKPLDVIWLCAKCHHRLHATFPELGGHFEAVG